MAESDNFDEMPPLEPIGDLGLLPAEDATSAAMPPLDIINIGKTSELKPSDCHHDSDLNNNQVILDEERHNLQQRNAFAPLREPEVLPGSESGDVIGDCKLCPGKRWAFGKDDSSNGRQEKDEPSTSSPILSPLQKNHLRFPRRLTARELAAKSLAADNGGWLVFDPDEKQSSTVQSEAEEFLAKYLPSKVKEVNGNPISWISAMAPMGEDESEEDENDEMEEDEKDVDGLVNAWRDLQESGQHATFQTIKELAVAHSCLNGKWMLWKDRGPHINLTWERIFRATIAGKLGISTKVSSVLNEHSWIKQHLICVYNRDFTDKADVMELETRLRRLGIRCRLSYKPDAFSYLGVYRGNEWGLKPIIYTSEFDVCKNCSTIVSGYE